MFRIERAGTPTLRGIAIAIASLTETRIAQRMSEIPADNCSLLLPLSFLSAPFPSPVLPPPSLQLRHWPIALSRIACAATIFVPAERTGGRFRFPRVIS